MATNTRYDYYNGVKICYYCGLPIRGYRMTGQQEFEYKCSCGGSRKDFRLQLQIKKLQNELDKITPLQTVVIKNKIKIDNLIERDVD